MTLFVQTPHEEELKEYFTPPKSLDYNEDGAQEDVAKWEIKYYRRLRRTI